MTINIRPDMDSQVASWMRSKGLTIPALIGADPERLRKLYGVTGAPETFLLNRAGRVLFKHVGFVEGDERALEAEARLMLGLDPFPGSEAVVPTRGTGSAP